MFVVSPRLRSQILDARRNAELTGRHLGAVLGSQLCSAIVEGSIGISLLPHKPAPCSGRHTGSRPEEVRVAGAEPARSVGSEILLFGHLLRKPSRRHLLDGRPPDWQQAYPCWHAGLPASGTARARILAQPIGTAPGRAVADR